MEFKLSKKLEKWCSNHVERGCVSKAATGEQFLFEFIPTGIIECQTVRCMICGEKKTDYVD